MMVYNSQQCQVASLQLTANCDIKRSGEPSRLSLSRQWIFRRAFSMTLIHRIYYHQPLYFIELYDTKDNMADNVIEQYHYLKISDKW